MPLNQDLEQRWSDDAIDPDLKIFGTLMQGILWRPTDSGRQIVLDWLEDIASHTVAICQSSNKQERRERFKQGLAEEALDKVQALVTYDAMRLNDPSLPFLVRTGRYMPAGLHTPRLTVVAVKDLSERGMPGTYAYFFAEPHERAPVFFDGLPPSTFTGARPKSMFYNESRKRISDQLQALVDIFSNHEKFLIGTLQSFFESSSSLADAPTFGIVNQQFLTFLMCSIQRWPTLDDCRQAIEEEQRKLCTYIDTIRFEATDGLVDALPRLGATYLQDKS